MILDFGIVRSRFGRLRQAQVDGFNQIVDEGGRREFTPRQLAYVLATAWHETGGKMQPVSENLNYSAKALRAKWSTRFSAEDAERFGRTKHHDADWQAIANRAYGNRIGNGDVASGDGWTFRGRGYVQITGRRNYRVLGDIAGLDLVGEPDLALEPRTACFILCEGMERGLFTGKALRDYINGGRADYKGARYIVNGQDKAALIAKYAGWFENALTQAAA